MTLETLILERTLKSGALKRLSISDTADKPVQANIQGVGINIFKNQQPNGKMTSMPESGCKIYGRRVRLADQL